MRSEAHPFSCAPASASSGRSSYPLLASGETLSQEEMEMGPCLQATSLGSTLKHVKPVRGRRMRMDSRDSGSAPQLSMRGAGDNSRSQTVLGSPEPAILICLNSDTIQLYRANTAPCGEKLCVATKCGECHWLPDF